MKELFHNIQDNQPNVKISLATKLLCDMKINEDDLYVDDNLDVSDSDLSVLPDNLFVSRNLNISYTNIIILPKNLYVGGSVNLINSKVTILPDDLRLAYKSLIYVDYRKRDIFKKMNPKFVLKIL